MLPGRDEAGVALWLVDLISALSDSRVISLTGNVCASLVRTALTGLAALILNSRDVEDDW